MTRLWVWSDLHLETEGDVDLRDAIEPDGFDAIVVAGDVSTPGMHALHWLGERYVGCRLVYVAGNHDLWTERSQQWTAEEMVDDMREAANRYGFHLLDRDSVEIDGVDIHGATLWTDLRLGYADRGQAHATARRGMNDYRRIRRRPSGRHHYIRPEDTLGWHHRDLAWLEGALTTPDGRLPVRPQVVVTHHAPSPRCLADPWDTLGHCYASDLRPFVERHRPDLWVHGHVHHAVDHMEGITRIVGNGRGRGAETRDWRPGLVIDLPPVSAALVQEVYRRT